MNLTNIPCETRGVGRLLLIYASLEFFPQHSRRVLRHLNKPSSKSSLGATQSKLTPFWNLLNFRLFFFLFFVFVGRRGIGTGSFPPEISFLVLYSQSRVAVRNWSSTPSKVSKSLCFASCCVLAFTFTSRFCRLHTLVSGVAQ